MSLDLTGHRHTQHIFLPQQAPATHRPLPNLAPSADKAIDLVDEAAAKLKMEITSKPLALDEVGAAGCVALCVDGHIRCGHPHTVTVWTCLSAQAYSWMPALCCTGWLCTCPPGLPSRHCPARLLKPQPFLCSLAPQVDRKVLQLEMERLSLVKAADTDRGARQRLAGLDNQLAGGWVELGAVTVVYI